VPDQRGDVVGHRLVTQRVAGVRGAGVRLQIDGDDPALRGERGQHRAEHLTRAEPAVQQHERLTGVVLGVVEGQAVHVRITRGISSPQTTGIPFACRWHLAHGPHRK